MCLERGRRNCRRQDGQWRTARTLETSDFGERCVRKEEDEGGGGYRMDEGRGNSPRARGSSNNGIRL